MLGFPMLTHVNFFAQPEVVEQNIPIIQAAKAVGKEDKLAIVRGKDPMVGREVLITKGPLEEIQQEFHQLGDSKRSSRGKKRRHYMGSCYSGYFGTVRSSSQGLNLYNVHLEATVTIVQVQRDIMVDRL